MVVDDDQELSQMMAQFLARNGFSVHTAANGAEVDAHLNRHRIDLILLDVMLGAENGTDLCRKLRTNHDVPIIFVSALSADHQLMAGYNVGADDYIAKPFSLDLLLVRIKAVLRRVRRSSSLTYRRNTAFYRFNGWVFNSKSDEAFAPSGVQVALSQRETRLLKVLLANPHIALTREEIITAMDVTHEGHSIYDGSGRALDVLVGRLRTKIENDPKAPEILRTERGVGYIFATDVEQTDA